MQAVPSPVKQLTAVSQSEMFLQLKKLLQQQNITGKVDNICTFSGIKMAETPDIDTVFCKLKTVDIKDIDFKEKSLYFSFEFKKATNLGKLYLLPKIHKRLFDVPGPPVIPNCRTTPWRIFQSSQTMCLNQFCNKVDLISKILVTSLRNFKNSKRFLRMLLWSQQMWLVSIPVSLMILGWRL